MPFQQDKSLGTAESLFNLAQTRRIFLIKVDLQQTFLLIPLNVVRGRLLLLVPSLPTTRINASEFFTRRRSVTDTTKGEGKEIERFYDSSTTNVAATWCKREEEHEVARVTLRHRTSGMVSKNTVEILLTSELDHSDSRRVL